MSEETDTRMAMGEEEEQPDPGFAVTKELLRKQVQGNTYGILATSQESSNLDIPNDSND